MPELTVTEPQRERLATIQADLEAAYVDTYGHVRPSDAIQYLLDTYTPPGETANDAAYERIATAEFQQLQALATDVDGVPGSGIETEALRGELLSTLGVEEFAARLADVDGSDPSASERDADGATSASDDTAEPKAEQTTEPASDADSDHDEDAGGDADGESSADSEGPGSVLAAANQLLDNHDDKWREGGGNEPYEVDLPDGTTEEVRTKDDVRGLLFKHY